MRKRTPPAIPMMSAYGTGGGGGGGVGGATNSRKNITARRHSISYHSTARPCFSAHNNLSIQ